MLGNTLANLDNEVRFFRDTLSGCVTGDYFLADFTITNASADDPEEIRRKEPVLHTLVPAAHANWLGGPLRRYCKDLRDVEFSVELDTHCTVDVYKRQVPADRRVLDGSWPRSWKAWRLPTRRRFDPRACVSESLRSALWCLSLIHI